MTRSRVGSLLALLLVAALAGAAWWWWQTASAPPVPAPAAGPPVAAGPAAPPEPPASGPLHPIEATADLSPLAAPELAAAVDALLGPAGASFVLLDDLPRRIVATVDNLGRAHAPTLVWPTPPTGGRFTAAERNGATVIAADNAARYLPFVRFAESLDAQRTVDLYVRMYPLLQAAYRELGFPSGHFNDRLVQVIDLLLATPQPQGPVELELDEVKGPVPSLRPWVRYRFADPRLEQLAAGQKILLRMGPDHAQRLKRSLAALRAEIVKRGQRR